MNKQICYKINRAFSIKISKDNKIIYVGINPPLALQIIDPPACLGTLLQHLNYCHTWLEMVIFLVTRCGCKFAYAEALLKELIDLGIIIEEKDLTRYDRHQLFFNLHGIESQHYLNVVSSLCVGLIGLGGVGSVCASLLAGAGIQEIILCDDDYIEESNLSRSLLYNETHIGQLKVEAAYQELMKRNSSCRIIAVPRKIDERAIEPHQWLDEYFAKCDFILLSADTPFAIHSQVNLFCQRNNIANINVGYVEAIGAVGPLFIPHKTACFECEFSQTLAHDATYSLVEVNKHIQASSFGPLNAYVSAIAINEMLRYFFDLNPLTLGKKLLIDFSNYKTEVINIERLKNCSVCH